MRIQDIEIGKTYEGRKGKPRTVVAKRQSRWDKNYFEVDYTTGGENTKSCWCATFAGWAKSDTPTETITALKQVLEAIAAVPDQDEGRDIVEARWIASHALAQFSAAKGGAR